MAPSTPDDHDEVYLEDRRRAALAAEFDDSDGLDDEIDDRHPNFAARRTAVVVAVAVLIAVVVGVLVVPRGDDALVLDPPEWNVIVDVARATGEIEVIDDRGRRLTTIGGEQRATALYVEGRYAALEIPLGLQIVDLVTERTREVQLERNWQTIRLAETEAFVLRSSPRTAGTVAIIDGTTGRQLDIADIVDQRNPLLIADSVRSDPAGRAFAVGDGRNFQTIVVSFDGDEPAFFPGAPLALGDEYVITASTIGPSAELGIFERSGTRVAAVTTRPPIGGVLTGDRFVYVTADGQVLSVDPRSSRPSERGLIPVPGGDEVTDVVVAGARTRLIARGERFITVVDLDGEIILQSAITTSRIQPAPMRSWRCMPVVLADRVVIADLVDGRTLADVAIDTAGGIDAVSIDGCGVTVAGVFVSAAGTYAFGPVRTALPTPDGGGVVIVGADNRARLVTVDDGTGDTVDLGEVGTLIGFGQR